MSAASKVSASFAAVGAVTFLFKFSRSDDGRVFRQTFALPTMHILSVNCETQVKTIENGEKNAYREEVLGVDFGRDLLVIRGAWTLPAKHSYVSSAPRCMHDACWFPPARAYSLGLYVDRKLLDSFVKTKNAEDKTMETLDAGLILDISVDKTLQYVFVGEKENKHIINGFKKALINALPKTDIEGFDMFTCESQVMQFVTMLKHLPLKNGSVLQVSFFGEPHPGRTIITFAESKGVEPEFVGEIGGNGLRLAFHQLYLERDRYGRYKYPSIIAKFEKDIKQMMSEA